MLRLVVLSNTELLRRVLYRMSFARYATLNPNATSHASHLGSACSKLPSQVFKIHRRDERWWRDVYIWRKRLCKNLRKFRYFQKNRFVLLRSMFSFRNRIFRDQKMIRIYLYRYLFCMFHVMRIINVIKLYICHSIKNPVHLQKAVARLHTQYSNNGRLKKNFFRLFS